MKYLVHAEAAGMTTIRGLFDSRFAAEDCAKNSPWKNVGITLLPEDTETSINLEYVEGEFSGE